MSVKNYGRSDRQIIEDNERFYHEALADGGDYHLLMGSCYVDRIFNMATRHKWYLCRVINMRRHLSQLINYCKLSPVGVLFVTALGNAAAILNKQQLAIHPPLWRAFYDDIDNINVPVLMLEMPAAFHRCSQTKKNKKFLQQAKNQRDFYKSTVVGERRNITHIDLMDYVDYKYIDIVENRKNLRAVKAPWHSGDKTLIYVLEAYDKFLKGTLDPNYFEILKSVD